VDTNRGPEELSSFFAALADPTRLNLLRLLSDQRQPDALCVNALASLLGVSQSAVSQHLRVLRTTGLVRAERRGYRVHYFVNRQALERYQRLMRSTLLPDEKDKAPKRAKDG
jgi:ArsR family transcriptional regulator, arsenate/arsenite/antimonite-responsive transcriptional repressor